MKIKFKNFIIEEDNRSFILTEFTKNKTTWAEYMSEQTYPSTLLRCLEKIHHKLKKGSTDEITLQEYMARIEEINTKFLDELKWVTFEK